MQQNPSCHVGSGSKKAQSDEDAKQTRGMFLTFTEVMLVERRFVPVVPILGVVVYPQDAGGFVQMFEKCSCDSALRL